jgi:hypothetical protein
MVPLPVVGATRCMSVFIDFLASMHNSPDGSGLGSVKIVVCRFSDVDSVSMPVS